MLHVPSYELGKLLGAFDRERGIDCDVTTLSKGVLSVPEWHPTFYPEGTEGNAIPFSPMSMMEGYLFANPNTTAARELHNA